MSYFIPTTIRSVRNDDGVVLLNLQSGAYFTLNAVGTLVWEQLQSGGTRESALAALQRRFKVPEDRLSRDIDALLARLIDKGLLAHGDAGGAGPPAAPAAPAGVVQAMAATAWALDARACERERFTFPQRLLWSILGYAALVAMDVLVHIAGFASLHRFVSRWRTRSRPSDPSDAGRISAAVDAASAFYFKHAWCLQRSAATTCLLRLRGFPAELVIGVKRVPFMAHAWVDVGGCIVNDNPRYCELHEVIERC